MGEPTLRCVRAERQPWYAPELTKTQIPPGRLALAIALFFGSGLVTVAVVLIFLFSSFASLLRVDAPGTGNIRLEKGRYTVYWESAAMRAEGARAPAVQVRIDAKDDGPSVKLEPMGDLVTRYSTLETAGASMADFSIERAGDYDVSVTAPATKQAAPGRISLGRHVGIAGVLMIVLPMLLLDVVAMIAAIVVLLKSPKPPATPASPQSSA
jgi:hypothetical protein